MLMKKSVFKSLIGVAMATMVLGGSIGVASNVDKEPAKAEAAISKSVSKLGIYDKVNSDTRVVSIESISFASGYNKENWESFLDNYLSPRTSFVTTKGTNMPSTPSWSYKGSDTTKYYLCPTGSKDFEMFFPEWITAYSFVAYGNKWYNEFKVGNNPVSVHGGWGIGKFIYGDIKDNSGWYLSVGEDATAQSKQWGDVTVTEIAQYGSTEIERRNVTLSKYYKLDEYSLFGYSFGGWYSNLECTTEHSGFITSTSTLYAKETLNKIAHIAGTMNGWNKSDDNYLMMPAENSQYRIVTALAKDVEFKVVLNDDWHGWSQVDQSSNVVKNGSIVQGTDPDSTGFRIKVAVAGTYEIYIKTTADTNKIWIQQDSVTEAKAYAVEFLTTITCSGQGSVTFQINKWNKVGSETISMEYKIEQLTQGAKHLMDGTTSTSDTDILNARERYDEVLGKHGYGTEPGQYHDFMGRKPAPRGVINPAIRDLTNGNVNNSNIWIIVTSVITVAGVSVFFFLKKRKEDK